MTHFKDSEFTRTETGLPNIPGPDEWAALHLLRNKVLDPLRVFIGAPISINSGFRSYSVNRKVGGSPTSDHLRGRAADIVVGSRPGEWLDGWGPERLAEAVLRSGVEFDQLIKEPGWVHVSFRYGANRRQVLQKTRDGYAPWRPA